MPRRRVDSSSSPPTASTLTDGKPLRVVHCPVNTAGVPWANVEALRRRGVDAQLVVFNRYTLHPEADWSLERRGGLVRKQLTQWSALARLLPRADVFHFYFGLTLVPQSLQFPILRALRKKSVMHYLGSDIRGKSPDELASGKKAGAQVVGSYDAIRWVPEAEMIPPGIDLTTIEPVAAVRPRAPRDPARALVAPAQGNGARHRGVRGARRRPRPRRGPSPRRGVRALPRGGHRRRPAQCRLVRALRDRVHGARQARRHVPPRRGRRAHRAGARHARADRERDEGQPSAQLEPLVASAPSAGGSAPSRAPTSSRCTTSSASPTACSLSTLASDVRSARQLKRLGKHSAIYGLGGLVSRILAVLLLPLYTRYLSPSDYGKVETLIALTTVIGIVLRMGISSAFFRFYFDSPEPAAPAPRPAHLVLVHDGDGDAGPRPRRSRSRPRSRRCCSARRRPRARRRPLRRSLGRHELRAAHRRSSASRSGRSPSSPRASRTSSSRSARRCSSSSCSTRARSASSSATSPERSLVYAILVGYRREQLGLQFDRPLYAR